MYPSPWICIIFLTMASRVSSDCRSDFDITSGTSGTFESPNFPAPYPERSNCRYLFKATDEGRVKIKFYFFELEDPNPDTGCVYDHLDVYSVDNQNDKVLMGQFCGAASPEALISLHPRLELHFRSDWTKSMKGFLGQYEFLGEAWLPFESSIQSCGPSVLKGLSGQITSPESDFSHSVEKVQCSWLIKAEKDKHVLLHFTDANLDPLSGDKCNGSRIELYNGFPTPVSVPDHQVCGQLTHGREFLSKSSRLVIRYLSDGSRLKQASSFRIIWTAVNLSGEGKCDGHLCGKRQYCMDKEGTVCNPLLRFCVHQSLVCNQQPNCGPTDDSDENMCWKDVAIICVSVLVPLFMTILIASLTFYCYKKQKVKQSVTLQHVQLPPPPLPHDIERLQYSPGSSRRHCSKMLHTSFMDGEVKREATPSDNHGNAVDQPIPEDHEHRVKPCQAKPEYHVHQEKYEVYGHQMSPEDHMQQTKPENNVHPTKSEDYVPLQAMKRPSYHMMKQTFTDGGGCSVIIAEI